MGLVGDLFATLGRGVLTAGVLDIRQQLSACPHEMSPAPEQIPGRPHLRGRDRGFREHAPAQEGGPVLGIDRVVCGLPPVHGLHRQGMTQDKGNTLLGTESSEPIPGDEACNGHNKPRTGGSNSLAQRGRSRCHGTVQQPFPVMPQDTDGPCGGRAGRYRRRMGVGWWGIALRSPSS